LRWADLGSLPGHAKVEDLDFEDLLLYEAIIPNLNSSLTVGRTCAAEHKGAGCASEGEESADLQCTLQGSIGRWVGRQNKKKKRKTKSYSKLGYRKNRDEWLLLNRRN
jgi:hypothetical protein